MKKRLFLISPLLALASGIEAKPKPEKQNDEIQAQHNSVWAEFQHMHEEMVSMFKHMDNMFERTSKEFFNDDLFDQQSTHNTLTLEEKDGNLIASIKLANVDPDSINVSVDDTGFGSSTLTISASRNIQKEEDGKKTNVRSNIFESRTLPYQVISQATTAEYSQAEGTLIVTMPKEKPKNSITVVKK